MSDKLSDGLIVEQDARGVATLTLNRPEVHNAFDEALMVGLTEALTRLGDDASVRAVVLASTGKSFSAGADLNWMKRMSSASFEESRADAVTLGAMLAVLDGLSKPSLGIIQGPAYGGGVGLVAACDIVIASENAKFCLTEVKLGLAPAVVAPYVTRAIGARQARRYFLTAERFDAIEARRIGLVHEVVPAEDLDTARERVLDALSVGAPLAQGVAKRVVGRVSAGPIDAAMNDEMMDTIARMRTEPEGREGIAAFLEKRVPFWRGGE